MSSPKKRVAILFGGRSTEHQISLLSAKNVIGALDLEKFEPVLIGIDKKGRWHLNEGALALMHADDPNKIAMVEHENVVLLSHHQLCCWRSDKTWFLKSAREQINRTQCKYMQ